MQSIYTDEERLRFFGTIYVCMECPYEGVGAPVSYHRHQMVGARSLETLAIARKRGDAILKTQQAEGGVK